MSQTAQPDEKKILWVFSSFANGAPQRRLAALIERLSAGPEGRYTHVLLSLDDNYEATRMLDPGASWRILDRAEDRRGSLGGGSFALSKLWTSRRILAAERPDLLVTAGLGATEWLASNRGSLSAPHLHFQDPVGDHELLEAADSRGDWARRRAFPGRNRLFVASDAETAKALTERWGAAKASIRKLPWGVDLDLIRPKQHEGDEVVFGSLTPLVEEKRHDRLLRILASLRERGRSAQVRLVGRGPERARLQRLAETMEIEPYVTFVERDGLDPRVAWEETGKFDVFVDLADVSRHGAGAALAMAAGLPILGADQGATAEAAPVENGLFLRSPRDESALTAAAELLAADADLRHGVGAANRAAAEQALGLEQMVEQFIAMMEEFDRQDQLALPAPKPEMAADDQRGGFLQGFGLLAGKRRAGKARAKASEKSRPRSA